MATPDPAALRAHAQRLFAAAQNLRDLGTRITRAVLDTPWQGRAADAFQARTGDLNASYYRAADRVDEAARALAEHAVGVESALRARAAEAAAAAAAAARDAATAATPPCRVVREHVSIPHEFLIGAC